MILIHESGSQAFIDIKKFNEYKSLNADSVGSLHFIPAMIRGYVLPCLLAKPIWRIQLIYTCKLIIETRYVYMMHSAAMAVADMTGMICHGPLARYVQLQVAPGMRLECRECFPYHRGMSIPTCRHSRRMRNQQFYLSGKRPMAPWFMGFWVSGCVLRTEQKGQQDIVSRVQSNECFRANVVTFFIKSLLLSIDWQKVACSGNTFT